MKKRILFLLLMMCLLCSLMLTSSLTASAASYTGVCGDNLTWALDTDSGVLTISGSGSMENYSGTNSAWYSYRSYITTVQIANGVTTIGNRAFKNCTNLRTVTIPNSVTSIGVSAFEDCSSLTGVTIPGSVVTIGESAFDSCKSIKTATLGDGVANIGDYAFYSCTSLQSAPIPNSVETIGSYAFYKCTSLTDVTVPGKVKSIGSYAFYSCNVLTNATLVKGVEKIGKYAFFGCVRLKTVSIPNSVTSIGNRAFEGCSILESITIPGSVITIGEHAFDSCKSIKTATLGDGVANIGAYAFYSCTALQSASIPSSVKTIGSCAFYKCTSLTAVTIPGSVATIEHGAFDGCSNLTYLTLQKGINEISTYAFANCTGLKSVTIPSSVKTIGSYAFHNCTSLTSATIPDSVTTIDSYTFSDCSSLQSVTIPNSVTSIRIFAFRNCTMMTNVAIPDGVTTIEAYAFYDCSSLTSVTIPKSVTSIGMSAFSGCSALARIEVYHPDCTIGDARYTLGKAGVTTLYGHSGSTTAAYAEKYGYGFVVIETENGPSEPVLTEAPSDEMLHCIFSDMSYAYIPSSFAGKTVGQWLAAAPWENESSGEYTKRIERKIYHSSDINRIDVYGLLSDWTIRSVETGEAGYAAVVFSKGDHTIIAYRGSEDGFLSMFLKDEDWRVDANFALFDYLDPRQFDAALDTYLKFKGKGYITLTGHSLGGALTAYVSILENVKGYAFDGACGHVVDLAFAYKPLDIDFSGIENTLYTNYTDPKQLDIIGADYIQHTNEHMFPGVCYQSNEDCIAYYPSYSWTHHIYSNTRLTDSGKGIEFMPVAETHRADSVQDVQFGKGLKELFFLNNKVMGRGFATVANVVLGTKENDRLTGRTFRGAGYACTMNFLYGGDGCDTISGSSSLDVLLPNELSGDTLSGGNGNDCYILECNPGGTVYISDHSGTDRIILNHAGSLSAISVQYLGMSADKKWHCYYINGNILVYVKATKIRFEHHFEVIDENGDFIATIGTEGELSFKSAMRKETSDEVSFKEIYIEGNATIRIYDESNNFVADFSTKSSGLYPEDYGTIEIGEHDDIPFLSASLPSIYHVNVSGDNVADITVIGNNSDGYIDRVTLAEGVNLSAGETEILMAEHNILQNSASIVTLDNIFTKRVEINQESLLLHIGNSAQLTAMAFFADGRSTADIFWISSDPSVVTCESDDAGRCTVKAISSGEATIYAIASDSGIAAECKVQIAAANPFHDVQENYYYYTPILWAVENGITNGTGEGKFSPDEPCTRGQIVTFLWRAYGCPQPTGTSNPFDDVDENFYYYKAILWAVEKGITTGLSANKFGPDEPCTRGQVATFLWRAQGKPAPTIGTNPFTDLAKDYYYYSAVLWAVENKVTNGTGEGRFSPDENCTRGQIVTFLYRALN